MSHTELTHTASRNNGITADLPDPEVIPTAKRRRFSAEYKLRILQEADAFTEPGQVGALLRREGLYSSYLADWRRQRRQGQLAGLQPRRRGRPGRVIDPQGEELARLRQENQRLQQRLEQAELIIDVQKKLSRLLGPTPSETPKGELP